MQTRRDFLKKAGYAAPAIVTLSAVPSFASAGSSRPEKAAKSSRRRNEQNRRKRRRNGEG